MARELAREAGLDHFQRAGIVDVGVRGFFPLETELRSFYGGVAERCAEVAVKVGAISEIRAARLA